MRHKGPLLAAAAAVAVLGTFSTQARSLAQGSQTGQERFVVFEMFAREA